MKVFQIGHIYPAHREQLLPHLQDAHHYDAAQSILCDDLPKSHILKPCLEKDKDAFLSYHQEYTSMRLWAEENGLRRGTPVDEILLAQIEAHGAEVLYNVHASAMPASLLQRLPGCVRLKIAWLGSPVVGDGFPHFDAVVSNFPAINARHRALGLRSKYFFPSFDPTADMVGAPVDRDIDVLFVGGYSRHHKRRARFLRSLATVADEFRFSLHLDKSRYTDLAETPLGWIPPLSAVRRPKEVRRIAKGPIFGRALFKALARTRIAVNMAIDMAGTDRGNMRCFEALSSGAVLLSDAGNYPEGFIDGETMLTYSNAQDALDQIRALLNDSKKTTHISGAGRRCVNELYSKERQWEEFQVLCATIA